MKPCPLNPSPLTTLRRKYRLTMHEAAEKLDLSVLQLARIETATRRIPVRYLKRCAGILVPVSGLVQLSMFDVPEDDEVGEEGGGHA